MFRKKKKQQNKNPLITHVEPKSTVSEKFRGIRSNIMFSSADGVVNSVVITSEKPSAGKSTVSSNIAITYAQANYKTLLIDGDLRKGTINYLFNKSNLVGLSSAIVNSVPIEEAIQKSDIENLDIITSGPVPPNPSELIGSSNFELIFKELSYEYDFIIIDTPPVNTVTDAQLFIELVKNTILVVDTEDNNKDEVKKSKELAEKAGAKILGVILNKAKVEENSSYYYYYGAEND